MEDKVPVSVVILTKNESARIRECIDSARWAQEILVVDDESADNTVAIAGELGARVLKRKMDIEGRHRNWAYAQAACDWVFSLDADERITPELQAEIVALFEAGPKAQGYTVPRRNYLGRHWIRHGGWYPSPQLKLFLKEKFRYEEVEVHPRAFMDSDSVALTQDLIHYSYRDLSDFLGKLNRQTTLEAQKWLKEGSKMSFARGLRRTFDRFLRSWWGKGGRRDGFIGYWVAVFAGFYQFLSLAKFWVGKTGTTPRGDKPKAPAPQNASLEPPPKTASQKPLKLSAVILTKNAAGKLPHCLESIRWVDEIVVVDGGSTDETLPLAQAAGAKVVTETTADDFGALRNLGAESSSGDWILQLDADEVVTPAFRSALEGLLAHPTEHAAYKFRRQNNFLGHWMRFGGWDHDSLHLFRKGKARYQGRVHEQLIVNGSIGLLSAGVEHTPFNSLEEFVDRQNRYTTLEARQLLEKEGSFPIKTLRYQTAVRPVKLIWKILFKKQGIREGIFGILFAGLYAFVHFLKWAKIWEFQDAKEPTTP